jgi:enoyl-CoA hydratase/carnithine racemase
MDPFKIDMPPEVLWRMNPEKTVAVITLNRPNEKNAMNDPLTSGMMRASAHLTRRTPVPATSTARPYAPDTRCPCVRAVACARIKAMPSLRVAFLTGNGAMFCAGGALARRAPKRCPYVLLRRARSHALWT